MQIRLPTPAGGSTVFRASLGTSVFREARGTLMRRMAWLAPMQEAKTDDDRLVAILKTLNGFKRQGLAATPEDLSDREAFESANRVFVDRVLAAERQTLRTRALELGWTQFGSMQGHALERLGDQAATRPDGDEAAGFSDVPKGDEDDLLHPWDLENVDTPQPEPASPHNVSPPPPTPPPAYATAAPSSQPREVRPAETGSPPEGLRWSEVLQRYLSNQAKTDGNKKAEADHAPIVRFAISFLSDPVMMPLAGHSLVDLKEALADIPTLAGFRQGERDDLHLRYEIAKKGGWRRNVDGKDVVLKRVSKNTLTGRYRVGLKQFYAWAVENGFVGGPVPDFTAVTAKNPGKRRRDAFRGKEVVTLVSLPLFTGCASLQRIWTPGPCFVQSFFYWTVLITLLCGLRPGEISQLRCRDIMDLHGKPHFRFARFSDSTDDDDDDLSRAGAKQGKTPAAYRWVTVHPLLIELGLLDRRDSIIAVTFARLQADRKTASQRQQWQGLDQEQADDQWLFPEWPIYVSDTKGILWSHATSKVWQYIKEKFAFDRKGITLYSARHTFKGYIDDLKNLSERSRRVIMGHSLENNVTNQYGPKQISEQQMQIILELDNEEIREISEILLSAKRQAESGGLRVVEAWRNDQRSPDAAFQRALAYRSEMYG